VSTPFAAAPPRSADAARPSCVRLAHRFDASPAATVLQMVARGGEALDPERTPAGDFLRAL
jgi:hypothetical protein